MSEQDGIISGYASVFNVKDAYGDIVDSGAFQKCISNFNNGDKPKLLWQHDISCPIGVVEELYEDSYGLFIKAKLILEVEKAREVYSLLKNNAINGFSIGYKINKKNMVNDTIHLTDLDVIEISVVTFPACEQATVLNVKGNNMNKEIQKIVKELNDDMNSYMQSNNKKIEELSRRTMPMSEKMDNEDFMKKDFENFIRNGSNKFFTKSLNCESDEKGKLLIPSEITEQIKNRMKYLSPMRSIAKIMHISRNNVDVIADYKGADAGWSGNSETRDETDAPEIKKIQIPVHEIYAKPKAAQHLLDDAKIDVENWLINKIAEKFAILENLAFIKGTGTDKPIGFLSAPSSDNETREFGTLQHFCTGLAGKFDDDTALDILINLACSLKPIYVKNAKWLMSRSALSAVRKLKNADGISIWQPSMSESTPSTLLGYPVIIDDDMPALKEGTPSTSIAFGDFYAGYLIVDRQEFSILRDPYTSKPFVEFYATKRVGGAVVDSDAIKLLKFEE